MDYSLLVGIHDVDRAEQEEMEVEERAEEEECENDGVGGSLLCSYGTPPDSPGNLLSFPRFFGPGEFDPSVDVYAMKSHESKSSCRSAQPAPNASAPCCDWEGGVCIPTSFTGDSPPPATRRGLEPGVPGVPSLQACVTSLAVLDDNAQLMGRTDSCALLLWSYRMTGGWRKQDYKEPSAP